MMVSGDPTFNIIIFTKNNIFILYAYIEYTYWAVKVVSLLGMGGGLRKHASGNFENKVQFGAF